MKCQCPECLKSFSFDERKYNQKSVVFKCPACGGRISVDIPGSTPPPPEKKTPEATGFKGALSEGDVSALKELHGRTGLAPLADSLKTVLFLHYGLSPDQTARLLMTGRETVLRTWKTFRDKGLDAFQDSPRWEEMSPDEEARLNQLMRQNRLRLELGYDLLPLLDREKGGRLLDGIPVIRNQVAAEFGWSFGPVGIVDNMTLAPGEYRLLVNGVEAGRGTVEPGRLLAIRPEENTEALDAPHEAEPVYGLPSLWLPAEKREEAESRGYSILEAEAVLLTHLKETAVRHAHEILGIADIRSLMDNLRQMDPVIPKEAERAPGFSPWLLLDLLRRLLFERVSIKDLGRILEETARALPGTREAQALAASLRRALGAQIVENVKKEGKLPVCYLPEDITQKLEKLQGIFDQGLGMTIAEDDEIVSALREIDWPEPVLLVSAKLRPLAYRFFRKAFPQRHFTVLCNDEIPFDTVRTAAGPFFFEDIPLLEDPAVAALIRRLDPSLLATALKGTSEELQETIYRNMEEEAAASLKEEMEFTGPVSLKKVREAQKGVVKMILLMESEGNDIIASSGEEELIV